MKKRIFYFTLAVLSVAFFACKDESADPIFNVDAPQTITGPTDASSFVFTSAQAGNSFEIAWTAAQLTPRNLQDPVYRVQMDFAGNNFASPVQLGSTSDLSVATTIGNLNGRLVTMTQLVGPDTTVNLELRVIANIENTAVDTIFSNVVGMAITAYNTVVNTEVTPIYMLGSATAAAWDNTAALEMKPLPDGKFSIVANLTAGNEIKFISDLGAWAPMWGTDGSGTWEDGPLVYRPTEADPDPSSIPSPDVDGQYLIIADTALLTYHVEAVDLIYLLGSATAAAWDNTAAIPMTYVENGVYTIIAELSAGNLIKFIDELGMWAPQWGTDATGTWESGPLVFRPDEATPDPTAIPSPTEAGMYRIDVNTIELTYTVTPQ